MCIEWVALICIHQWSCSGDLEQTLWPCSAVWMKITINLLKVKYNAFFALQIAEAWKGKPCVCYKLCQVYFSLITQSYFSSPQAPLRVWYFGWQTAIYSCRNANMKQLCMYSQNPIKFSIEISSYYSTFPFAVKLRKFSLGGWIQKYHSSSSVADTRNRDECESQSQTFQESLDILDLFAPLDALYFTRIRANPIQSDPIWSDPHIAPRCYIHLRSLIVRWRFLHSYHALS